MSNNIIELVNARLANYNYVTEQILRSLGPVYQAVASLVTPLITKRLQWEDVIYVESTSILMVIGSIKFEVGDNINGAIITPANKENYRQIIRIGIPVSLLDESNIGKIEMFLRDHTNLTNMDITPSSSIPTLGEVAEDDGDIFDLDDEDAIDSIEGVIESLERVEAISAGFDFDSLTKDQQQTIIEFTKEHGGKVH